MRARLGWLDVHAEGQDVLRATLDAALNERSPLTVGFINPHVYVTAEREPVVQRFLAACDRVCIDGIGIVIAHALAGRGRLPRVVAEQLFRAHWTTSTVAAETLLIGVEPGEVDRAAAAMNAASHGPRIVATLDGFATDATLDAFTAAHPTVSLVLIGAGSPRSEAIALRARAVLPHAVIFHCGGGTLKTWAGTKRRAPAWLSRFGLEWAHRVLFEPHARARYLLGGPRFLTALWRARNPPNDHRALTR